MGTLGESRQLAAMVIEFVKVLGAAGVVLAQLGWPTGLLLLSCNGSVLWFCIFC